MLVLFDLNFVNMFVLLFVCVSVNPYLRHPQLQASKEFPDDSVVCDSLVFWIFCLRFVMSDDDFVSKYSTCS